MKKLNTFDMYSLFKETIKERLSTFEDDLMKYERSYNIVANVLDRPNIKKEIDRTKAAIEECKELLFVDNLTYARILSQYNRALLDLIIFKGKTLDPGGGVGRISVEVKKVSQDRINWPETNEVKKAIIARGEIPFSKENPNGLKYFVKYTSTHEPFVTWEKGSCRLDNKKYYKFKPSRAATTRMWQFRKHNPNVIYTLYKSSQRVKLL